MEKTGVYDVNGRNIREGDKVKAVTGYMVITGEVVKEKGTWRVETGHAWRPYLWDCDELEVLEED